MKSIDLAIKKLWILKVTIHKSLRQPCFNRILTSLKFQYEKMNNMTVLIVFQTLSSVSEQKIIVTAVLKYKWINFIKATLALSWNLYQADITFYLFLFSVYKTEKVFKGTWYDTTELMSEALFLPLRRPYHTETNTMINYFIKLTTVKLNKPIELHLFFSRKFCLRLTKHGERLSRTCLATEETNKMKSVLS